MSNQPDIRRYRIGDFARYMGVTPDFLKHYEEHGLVQATHTEAGYRYYDFRQSARILEYMRLKNCGVSLKDMKSMLSAESDEALALMDERLEEVRRRMLFDAAVLEEYERFRNWYERRRSRPVEWEVREIEGRSFLPHTDGQDFIKDERIYELLKSWAAWMPVVKSGMLISPSSGSGLLQTAWGLVARLEATGYFVLLRVLATDADRMGPCRPHLRRQSLRASDQQHRHRNSALQGLHLSLRRSLERCQHDRHRQSEPSALRTARQARTQTDGQDLPHRRHEAFE